MAQLELSIEDEVGDFLRKERPLWPQAPTPCPVASCSKERKYSSFRDFMDHWSEIHHKMNTVYKCMSCRKLFATVKHKKAHTKAKIHQGQSVTFETVSKTNELYKDPGDTLPFKLGSAPFRHEMRQHQRRLQSLQRRIDANKWKNTRPDIPEEEKAFRLCRDERVVERKGVLYKDTNLWASPSKMKREKWE